MPIRGDIEHPMMDASARDASPPQQARRHGKAG